MVTRIPLRYLILISWLTCLLSKTFAQVPNISYTPAANVYQTGTAITTLTPANSGGAVPATTYGTVSTLASSATNINNPRGLTADGAGNLYEADFSGNLIYKITAAGVVSIFAGTGAAAELDANGLSAKFNGPSGIVYDGSTYLYVADNGGNTIRRITVAAPYTVTTIAGSGVAAELDGAGILAKFNKPYGIDYDGVAYLYVTDNAGNTIRRITTAGPYTVITIAGSGAAAESNGNGIAAKFNGPAGITYDGIGNLYITDATGNTIREVNTSGLCPVTTFAGSGVAGSSNATGVAATFKAPYGIAMDASGNLIIADEGNSLIRTITVPGAVVTTLAGNGTNADVNGVTTAAQFFSPYAVTGDNSGNIFTGDDNGTNSTVRQITLTGYVISTALVAGLNFSVTTGAISGTPTATQSATIYTITAYNSWGSSSTTVSIAVGTRNNWTGSVSSAWNVAGNWSLGFVPTQYDNAYIQGGSGYSGPDPTVTANATVYMIQFGTSNTPPNTTLTINSGITLTVAGSFQCHSGSTVTVAGTGTVTVVPGAEVDIINSTYPVTSTLLKINATATFTLQSDATGSAFVPAMPLGGSITGNVTVQRYITGGGALKYRDYRFFSSPVYSSNQTLGATTGNVYNLMYLKTGTATNPITTGTNGTTNGFDKTGNPTIYVYREDRNASNRVFTGGNYIGVANITAAKLGYDTGGNTTSTGYLPVGNGFAFFFRGSYTNAANLAGRTTLPVTATYYPNSVTVSQVGTLNQGTVPVNLWFNNATANSYQSTLSYTAANTTVTKGFNLVGNPYASSIDWSGFSNSIIIADIYGLHVDPTVYEYDPAQVNVYGTYNQQTGVALNNGNNIIVSGQGFFVHANAINGTLQFTETAKTSTQLSGSPLLLGTPVSNSAYNQYLRLNISKDSTSKFEILVGFNQASNNNYGHLEDDLYFPAQNPPQSLSIITGDNVQVVSKWLAFPKKNKADTVNLTVTALTSGTYTITKSKLNTIPQIYDIWLMDNYKKDSLDIRHNAAYVFDVDLTDATTFGSNRFKIIIRQNPVLAMHLLSFAATKATTGTQIIWTTENEQNYTNFTVERSTDNGKTFDVLGGFLSSASGTYSFLDRNPLQPGSDLYRIKLEDLNGTISYSEVLSLQYSTSGNNVAGSAVSIFPNPTTGVVNISISQNNSFSPNLSALQAANLTPRLVGNQTIGSNSYDVKIISITGTVVKTLKSSQSIWQENLAGLLPGTYIIQVMHTNDQSLVGKSTFVKL